MTDDYDFSDTDPDTRRLFWLVIAPFSVVLIGAMAMGIILTTDI